MSIDFIPTADIADILKENTNSCDIQFQHCGSKTTAVGKARTIRCYQDNLLIKQTLNSPGNNDILVIDGAAALHTALVGDLIAGAAVKNNWAGIIVYGAVRDRAVLATLPIAIKALGSNPRKSTQKGLGDIDVPVTLGNLTIYPGDYIFTDEDGLIAVPQSQLELLTNNS